MVTALLEGPPGAGKTAIAATVAMESGFPFARVVCASDTMVPRRCFPVWRISPALCRRPDG